MPDESGLLSNSSSESCAIILAAGKSTRMKSRIPKPLHPLCGRPLSRHVIEACREAGIGRVIVVVGHVAEAVKSGLGEDVDYALQEEQRGSGHAAQCAMPLLNGFTGTILVLAGDVPLLRAETVSKLLSVHHSTGAAATLLTAFLADATGYGRIVRREDGTVSRIVEHRDATDEERGIREWNPSIYCFQARALTDSLGGIRPNNVQGELYLTDAIGILSGKGERVEAVATDDAREVLGVNNRVELAEVGRILRERILNELMLSGVGITDPSSTYIDAGVRIGPDSVVEPNSFILGKSVIGEGCVIGPFSRIVDSSIGDETKILASQVLESFIANRVYVGPWSNIRPGCRLGDGVKIGDFVELKNATLGEKVSASHLTYIGDAEVGEKTNIGAGVVTCNYDGFRKHRTVIGKNAFIGTHTTLIAPVTVGDGAFIAAGSPINQDVPEDSLAIARTRPAIKPDWARKFRERNERNRADG